jgi:hypothetical protein
MRGCLLVGVVKTHCIVHHSSSWLGGIMVGSLVGPGLGSETPLPGAVGNHGPLSPIGKLKMGA